MPCSYHIDARRKLALIIVEGVVVGADLVEVVSSLVADPVWQSGYSELWDGRCIQSLTVDLPSLDRITRTVKKIRRKLGPGRAALVVHREVDFLIARLLAYTLRSRIREIRVFLTMEEAREWLGLEGEEE